MYSVKFTFFDGKEIEVEVEDNRLDKFLDSVGSNQIYYTENKEHGAWFNSAHVRYFFVRKQKELTYDHQVKEEDVEAGIWRALQALGGQSGREGQCGQSESSSRSQRAQEVWHQENVGACC